MAYLVNLNMPLWHFNLFIICHYCFMKYPKYTNITPESIIAALPTPSTSPVIHAINIAKPIVVSENFIILLLILMPPHTILKDLLVDLHLYLNILPLMGDITLYYPQTDPFLYINQISYHIDHHLI